MAGDRFAAVIVGTGFAGAATAWALTRRGVGPVLVLEREDVPGYHASGRNAAIARQTEGEPIVRRLAIAAMRAIRALERRPGELVEPSGGLLLATGARAAHLEQEARDCRADGLDVQVLGPDAARARFPHLAELAFDVALWSPGDGVFDIHGLLLRFLDLAREHGAEVRYGAEVAGLATAGGRVSGVVLASGETIDADLVVDGSGAWAGSWSASGSRPGGTRLPLQPLRRHLVVSGPVPGIAPGTPFTWHLDEGFYLRPEGDGLLLSPCDESPHPPGEPVTDPAALELLEARLRHGAPALAETLTVARSWACLRTFAPDRLPLLGPDPILAGLFHVSGLGGFGVTTSAAVGELVATLATGGDRSAFDGIDLAAISPARFAPPPPRGGP